MATHSHPRWGLMNTKGQYFCHPYRWDGKWLEWDYSAHDAHEWVDQDRALAAAQAWTEVHGDELVVVLL